VPDIDKDEIEIKKAFFTYDNYKVIYGWNRSMKYIIMAAITKELIDNS
jgi:membrane-bound lytic murein transglycosylase B